MSRTALLLRDVGFSYPEREPTLRHVTLGVPKGCLTVVLGPNGSGKTTLLRIAAGLVPPQQGDVVLADETPARVGSRRGRIGYIPQQLGLVRSASVMDNVVLGGLRHGPLFSRALGIPTRETRDAALAALQSVGLEDKADRAARDLSGGERQRVAIARTLVQKPDVIVADELIASLDAVQAHVVMEILRKLKRSGVAMLMSLHHIDVALANADQVAFLVRGGLSNPRSPAGMSVEEARWALTA